MSGTTTNFGWPYPTQTDPPDGATQIQQLAQAIDTYVKARTTTFQHNTGLSITASTGWGSMDYYWQVKFGMLFLRLQVTRTGASIVAPSTGNILNSQLATINDSLYMPPTQVSARSYCTATGGSSTIQPNGIWTLTDVNPTSTVATGDFVSSVFNYPVAL